MKLKEAYSTLELEQGATPEDAKKKYRELTKKYHPDINKEPGSEDKFKKINEAYQVVQSGKSSDLQDRHSSSFHRQVVEIENINVSATISFKESVLGCKREVKYSRRAKCVKCNGNGEIRINNGCKKCDGKGQVVVRQGPSIMISTCSECYGKSQTEECDVCHGHGVVHTDVSIHVSIPGGIANGTALRLQNMGNYVGSFMGFADQHTDAYCQVTVVPEEGLSLDGRNVVSRTTISLLDALKGCVCTVKTIHGDKQITIKPQSKNCEEVLIPNCGVNGIGNQRVILDIQYPKEIDKLIHFLNEVN